MKEFKTLLWMLFRWGFGIAFAGFLVSIFGNGFGLAWAESMGWAVFVASFSVMWVAGAILAIINFMRLDQR